jgi:hypothetical protein
MQFQALFAERMMCSLVKELLIHVRVCCQYLMRLLSPYKTWVGTTVGAVRLCYRIPVGSFLLVNERFCTEFDVLKSFPFNLPTHPLTPRWACMNDLLSFLVLTLPTNLLTGWWTCMWILCLPHHSQPYFLAYAYCVSNHNWYCWFLWC